MWCVRGACGDSEDFGNPGPRMRQRCDRFAVRTWVAACEEGVCGLCLGATWKGGLCGLLASTAKANEGSKNRRCVCYGCAIAGHAYLLRLVWVSERGSTKAGVSKAPAVRGQSGNSRFCSPPRPPPENNSSAHQLKPRGARKNRVLRRKTPLHPRHSRGNATAFS